MNKKLFRSFICLFLFSLIISSCNEKDKPQKDDPKTTDVGVVINGVRWATRNLETHGTFVGNPKDFGGLFQWGRRGDGHEQRDSPTTETLSSSDVPGHGNFIIIFDSPFDWRDPQNDNLWGNPKTANDPCPQGWRVPTVAEIRTLTNTNNVSSEWTTTNGVNGRTFTDINTDNAIFLPAVGLRGYTTGSLSLAGSQGSYWSASGNMFSAWGLAFNRHSVLETHSVRANGWSVRCVAE